MSKWAPVTGAESGGDYDILEGVCPIQMKHSLFNSRQIVSADCSKGAGNHNCYVKFPKW